MCSNDGDTSSPALLECWTQSPRVDGTPISGRIYIESDRGGREVGGGMKLYKGKEGLDL